MTESAIGVLELDRLLAQLSVTLINLPADRIDDAFRDALRRMGEAIAIDCVPHSVIDAGGIMIPRTEWRRPGTPPEAALVPAREEFPWTHGALMRGLAASFSCLDEIPHPVDRENYRAAGIRSAATVPLIVADRVAGTIAFTLIREERAWASEMLHRLNVFATALGSVLARVESEETNHRSLEDAERRRDQLRAENLYLRAEARERLGTGVVVGQSAAVRQVMALVQQVAATSSTVLLLGETGTGKELFATQIHELSPRRAPADGPRELRGDSLGSARERAVRPREGRLHRRARAAGRTLRAVGSLDHLPRRDRRSAARRAGEAAARARRASGRTARRPEADPRRHAHHRRDAPQPRTVRHGRHVSRRPVLPA